MVLSASNRPNTSIATKAPPQLYGPSLKSASKKTLETFRFLLIIFEVSWKKTFNTS